MKKYFVILFSLLALVAATGCAVPAPRPSDPNQPQRGAAGFVRNWGQQPVPPAGQPQEQPQK